MGVRIHAYAVDIPRLDAFLENSLAELLSRYVRDGIATNERLTVIDRDTDDTYVAIAHGQIRAATTSHAGRVYSTLTAADLPRFPVLQRSAREHLATNSIYCAHWLLQSFSRCAGIDFIHRLIDGHRRWWIGSILQYAEATGTRAMRLGFVKLFRKVLRGYDCGYPIPPGDIGVVTDGLPFSAEDDPDFRIGRWREDECRSAVELLSQMLATVPRFTAPPGPIGIAPDKESEWHECVYGNVMSLVDMGGVQYHDLNVLTFIG